MTIMTFKIQLAWIFCEYVHLMIIYELYHNAKKI